MSKASLEHTLRLMRSELKLNDVRDIWELKSELNYICDMIQTILDSEEKW